jgi:hypothetical protein
VGTLIAQSYASIGALNLSYRDDNSVLWLLQTLKGLGATQGTIAPVQKPRAAGAWAGTSYSKARTVVVTGVVDAPNAALASDALDQLNLAASLDTTVFSFTESGRTRFVNVRRDGDVLESWLNANAFTYSIQFVALDPRKFGAPLTGTTHLPSSSGGLVWPEVWPEVWSAVTNSGAVSLTNAGNTPGPVVLRIDGPCSGPQVSHTSTTNTSAVTFSSSLSLGVGEWLTVNMTTRQTLANDQSNRAAFIVSSGWSAFDPGVNVWSFQASAYSSAAQLTVTATPAWK